MCAAIMSAAHYSLNGQAALKGLLISAQSMS